MRGFNFSWPNLPLTLLRLFTNPVHIVFKIAKSPDVPLIKNDRSVLGLWVRTFKGSETWLFNGSVKVLIVWAVATTNPFISNISMAEMGGLWQCTTLQVKQITPVSVDNVWSKYSHGTLAWNSAYGAINFLLCNTSFIWDDFILIMKSLSIVLAINVWSYKKTEGFIRLWNFGIRSILWKF